MHSVPNNDDVLFAGPPELSDHAVEIYACHSCQDRTVARIDTHLTQCFHCEQESLTLLATVEPGSVEFPVYLLGNIEAAA